VLCDDNVMRMRVIVAPLTAPQELRANVSGWDSAIISWRGVSTGPMEEPLVGYVVSYALQHLTCSTSFLFCCPVLSTLNTSFVAMARTLL
jgi:hypothetical protein